MVCTFSLSKGSVVGDWLRLMASWLRRAGVRGAPHETVYHLLGFVVLGVLVGVALRTQGRLWSWSWWGGACACMFALGGVVEGLQVFVPARTVSWFDFGRNVLGAALGLGATTGVWALRDRT